MPKNKVFDALDKTFNTVTTEIAERKGGAIAVPDKEDEKLDKDFEEARNLLKRSAEYAEEAAQGILHVATNSDNPRAYEVAGQIIKTMGEQAKDMMEVQEKKHRIEKNSDEPKTVNRTTNNLVFTGTTSDMLKALKNENEKIIDHDADDPESS